jgi:hypothetical protein
MTLGSRSYGIAKRRTSQCLFAVNRIKTVLHATKVAAGLNGTEFGQNAIDLFLT